MALTTVHGGGGGGSILHTTPTRTTATTATTTGVPIRHLLFPLSSRRTLHIASAKKLSSRTGKFDSKNRRSTTTTTDQEDGEDYGQGQGTAEIERVGPESSAMGSSAVAGDDGNFLPELPGDKPDFWEGPQWDALGFLVQYMWAFGIGFALIACGIAVTTYNEGATDFKDTPAYKESVQTREFLEEPDSNSDVFESNPTEVAPSLE